MKILLSEKTGGPETLVLRDRPDPVPGPGEVLVAVRCIGVNYPDTLMIEDKYQFRPERPFAPGAELSGVVEALGEGVTRFAPGDRVMALPMWGAMAEKVCVPVDQCHPVPDGVSDADAAALQMIYGTALYALEERGDIRPGNTVLVLGAAGGVGLAAVELASVLGARVVAAASSEEKVAMAREHGADEGIVYPRGPLDKDGQKALSTAFRKVLGEDGADIVVDIVGGDYTEPALRCTGWGGRFLIIGFPAGIAKIPANLPLLKSCDIRGVFWGAAIQRDPEANRRAMARLLDLCAEGKIRPRIHASYPLAEGGAAIAALSGRGVMGKVLVEL
ncbi:NADPH2:quinone reductase [Lutimaribacter pacificus]|uniref:NADPH2:quinone reductase n=1 Tax=Lutimaribacter pacificus TaxID=391948 RepID=A0A1H0EN27_9RHOB|nr:NADPH:quinone oxidoreductase family protein [Lutimaribacter pacificus]SDN83716.1 NADPH2:quinone reductase [Lutimaribacter pacificus]SHK51079.1 NADPH2:quinone reductase [Lutimaribacter pacificus]